MKNKNTICTFLIVLLLTSCANKKQKAATKKEQVAIIEIPVNYETMTVSAYRSRNNFTLVPTRSTLSNGKSFPKIYGANGAIIFTKRLSMSRNQSICNAFINDFEHVDKFNNSEITSLKSLMVTHWLLDTSIESSDKNNCDILIDNYDYARASVIASKVFRSGRSDAFLIAFPNSDNFDDSIILDISNFSDEDLTRAFALWKKHISKGSSNWSAGLVFATAVQEFRSLIQKYGATILSKLNIYS